MIVELVKAEIEKSVDELSHQILAAEKSIVGAHSRSGAAVGSLHIVNTGEFSRFIGATGGEGGLHAYFLDEGNGHKIIKPKRARALKYTDGSLHGSSRPYKGIHWVRQVAARF